MRAEIVALDLETTGLDIETDSIIEIGAVRFANGEVLEEFETLINPGFVIPSETTHITGIYQDDLRNAPMLPAVLPKIIDFVGDSPVVAHNVGFDLGFMRRYGALKHNVTIDTHDLAVILKPSAARYSLAALTTELEIHLENAHRALDDARATARLYWAMWEKAVTLPVYVLREIVRAAQSVPDHQQRWPILDFFRDALQEAERQRGDSEDIAPEGIFAPYRDTEEVLQPNEYILPLDAQEIAATLSATGIFAEKNDAHEVREPQMAMAETVADAFNHRVHIFIEAGTGTGKSFAYLVPAVAWAMQNKQRVVISTNTLNLQEQLLKQDVPAVLKAMEADSIRVTAMKGRGNYLCPRRLATVRRHPPTTTDEMHTLAKILVWLQETRTGERGEITLRAAEYYVWNRLSAEDEGCTMQRCQTTMRGSCPYYKARKRADAAHLVIANHALLVSDALSENRVLPEYRYLIVDEAHQYEEAVTNGIGQRVRNFDILRRLTDLGGLNHGTLGNLLYNARGAVPDKTFLRLEQFVQQIGEAVEAAQAHVLAFYQAVVQFTTEYDEYESRIKVDKTVRSRNAFQTVRKAWSTLNELLEAITDATADLSSAIAKLKKYEIPELDDYMTAIAAAARNLAELRTTIHQFVDKPDENTVYWVFRTINSEYTALHTAPLHVGPILEQTIWSRKESVVMTSATLQVTGSFQFIKDRLYGESAAEVALGSTFDYRESTLLYIPRDIPSPKEPGYQEAVERGIVELATALDGRVLALFTSYAQLRETAANIGPRLALGKIVVYDQASGGSRDSLLDSFKTTEKAVLLGTSSFWEGIDIPGDDLSALVIVRLPFFPPNDPVFAARSDTYEKPFGDFALPKAILRFRQGFGRLIRTKLDRGLVTVFDSRIFHKSYGNDFIESLPDCTRQEGKLAGLADAAARWLNRPVSTTDINPNER